MADRRHLDPSELPRTLAAQIEGPELVGGDAVHARAARLGGGGGGRGAQDKARGRAGGHDGGDDRGRVGRVGRAEVQVVRCPVLTLAISGLAPNSGVDVYWGGVGSATAPHLIEHGSSGHLALTMLVDPVTSTRPLTEHRDRCSAKPASGARVGGVLELGCDALDRRPSRPACAQDVRHGDDHRGYAQDRARDPQQPDNRAAEDNLP